MDLNLDGNQDGLTRVRPEVGSGRDGVAPGTKT